MAIAHAHEPIWEDNRVVGYSNKIVESFPICRAHLDRLNPGWKGWKGCGAFAGRGKPEGKPDGRVRP